MFDFIHFLHFYPVFVMESGKFCILTCVRLNLNRTLKASNIYKHNQKGIQHHIEYGNSISIMIAPAEFFPNISFVKRSGKQPKKFMVL